MRNEEKPSAFIQAVIDAAMKKFVTGRKNQHLFRAQAETDDSLKQNYHFAEYAAISIKDEPFAYDATRIPGTNFIAAAGPRYKRELAPFFQNTAYHATIPVSEIVALGDHASSEESEEQDFHDYCLTERTFSCDEFEVGVRRLSGDTQALDSYKMSLPLGMVCSELQINKKNGDNRKLTVTMFELQDGYSLNLGASMDNSRTIMAKHITRKSLVELRKEYMWQVFQKSLKQLILVHCAQGIGRTGHFILTMEIMKDYERLFSGENPETCADNIFAILNNMRMVRPGLVYTENQFIGAIINAEILQHYGLERHKRHLLDFNYGKDQYTLCCWADLVDFVSTIRNIIEEEEEGEEFISARLWRSLFTAKDFPRFMNAILTDDELYHAAVNDIATNQTFDLLKHMFCRHCDKNMPKFFLEFDRAFHVLIANKKFMTTRYKYVAERELILDKILNSDQLRKQFVLDDNETCSPRSPTLFSQSDFFVDLKNRIAARNSDIESLGMGKK